MALSVSFQGLKGTEKGLKKLQRQASEAFRGAVYEEAVNVVEEAAKRAPSVTGNLKKSKFVTIPDTKGNLRLGFGAIYAASIEFGLKLINSSRERQKAAFARMRETGWSKSSTGGPGFFRGAIAKTSSGRIQRVARRMKMLFRTGKGFMVNPDIPTKPSG